MRHSPLQFSDTWVLVALLSATKPGSCASLVELISAADAVDHAVITRDELETGLARLIAGGLAHVEGDAYAPSTEVREFWEKKTTSWASLYKSWDQLSKHVGAEPARSGPLPQAESEQFVSKSAYEAAIATYLSRMGRSDA